MLFSSTIVRAALLVGSLLPAVRSEVFEVIVGGTGIIRYEPEFVNATAGDQVRFVFRQKNHTATQSTFDNPCLQAPGGFDTSFVPVGADVTDGFPVAELDITSDDPIWVFCAQGNHCTQGMVFAVNPGDRFDAFKAAAQGQAAPATTSTVAATTTAAASSTRTTAASTSTGTPAGAGTGTNHRVTVGENGLNFSPRNITAAVGDTVTFSFRPKNHTITQSSFANPCLTRDGGFNSGFRPVSDSVTAEDYTITINDTQPIWAYCAQGNHCSSGMVFSINSPENAERNFDTFLRTAQATAGGAGANPYGSGALSHSFTGAGAALLALLASTLLL